MGKADWSTGGAPVKRIHREKRRGFSRFFSDGLRRYGARKEKNRLNLNDIKPGDTCRIVDLGLSGATGQRLLEMGFMPGTKVTVVRNAPLVDPVDLQIRGFHISIRHHEAQRIEVESL